MFIFLTHSRYALSCVYLISLRFAEVGCLIEILSRLITKEKAKKSAFLRQRNFPKMGFLLWNSGKNSFTHDYYPKMHQVYLQFYVWVFYENVWWWAIYHVQYTFTLFCSLFSHDQKIRVHHRRKFPIMYHVGERMLKISFLEIFFSHFLHFFMDPNFHFCFFCYIRDIPWNKARFGFQGLRRHPHPVRHFVKTIFNHLNNSIWKIIVILLTDIVCGTY